MILTTVQDKIQKSAAFDGAGVAIDSITGDFSLCLEIHSLTGTVRFSFQDSRDAFGSDILAGPSFSMSGPLGGGGPGGAVRLTFNKRDWPDLRCGLGSAVLRLSVAHITSGTGSCTYRSWIES